MKRTRGWVGGGYRRIRLESVPTRGVNTVLYRPVRLVYTVPASKPVRLTPLFHIGKNTGRIGCIGQFRAIPVGTEFFFFNIYYYYFLSFVIFEFLLGKNGNLFALTY